MSNLSCESCLITFSTPRLCNSHICTDKVANLSKCASPSNSNCKSKSPVLKDNTSLINTDILRNSLDVNESETKKISKMLKEIEGCGLDISKVTSRTRRSQSSSMSDTKWIDKNIIFSSDKEIKFETKSKSDSAQNQIKINIEKLEINETNFSNNDKENTCINLSDKEDQKENHMKTEESHSSNIADNFFVPSEMLKTKSSISSNEERSEHDDQSSAERTDEFDRKAKSANKLSFSCQKCSAEFETFSQFKTHQVIHDFESRTNVRPWSSSMDSESATDYVSSSDTSEHKSPVKNRCLKRRKLDNDARNHSEFEQEERQELYKCDECAKVFYRNQRLVKHKSIYHSKKKPETAKLPSVISFKCPKCAKEFPNVRSFKNHKYAKCCQNASLLDLKQWTAVNNIPEFGCPICGMGFDKSQKLQAHRDNEHQNFQIPQKKSYR